MRTAATAVAVGLVAFVVYLRTLCPTMYAGDSGELAWAAASLGIAHPPGYPLFTLFGRIAVLLSPGSPALALNTLSALAAAAACGLLAVLVTLMTGRALVAAGVALAFAFSRDLWSQATITEVYALEMLFFAASLTAAVAARRGRPLLFLLAAYLLGLGTAGHPLVLTAGPAVLVLALWPDPEGAGPSARRSPARRFPAGRVLAMAGVFLLGLTMYLYIPARWMAGPEMNWGGIRNLADVVDHVFRAQYGGLGDADAATSLGVRLRVFAGLLAENAPGIVLVAAALGIGHALRGGARRGARTRGVVLALLLLTAGPLVAALVRYQDTFLDRSVASVFFLPAYFAAFLAAGVGIAAADRWVGDRLRDQGRLAGIATLLLAVAPAAYLYQRNAATSDRSHSTLGEVYSRAILESLPPGARLFTTGDNATFLLAYFQRVEGVRPDVLLSDRTLNLFVDSYGEDIAALSRPERKAQAPQREVEIVYADRGRPVFLTGEIDLEPFGGCRSVSAGLVYQLLRPGEAPAPIRYDTLLLPPIDPRDYLEAHLAGVALLRQGRWFAQEGRMEEALDSFHSAALVGARIAPILRNVGLEHLLLQDTAAAEEHFRAALALDPDDDDTLYNLAVLLAQTDRAEESLPYFDALAAEGTEHAEVHLNRGIQLVRLGRLEEAVQSAEQALRLEPELEPARRLEAAARRGIEVGGETGVLEARAAVEPLTVGGTLQLAEKYLERGDYGRALDLYREATQNSPDSQDAVYGLGYGLMALGQVQEAGEAFRRVLELDPDSARGRNALAYIYALTGENLAEAERLAVEALDLDPSLAAYWKDTLGWVRYRAGDLEGALAVLQEAEQTLPLDDISMRAENDYHLGVVLLEAGREPEARAYLTRSLGRARDEAWRPDLLARARELGIQPGGMP